MNNANTTKFALEEVGISYPQFYSASSAPSANRLTPSLGDVLAFARVPFDKLLKLTINKRTFTLFARKQNNQVTLVYQSGDNEIEKYSPAAIVAEVSKELPDAVLKGGYTVISYRGRTLFSFKKELITLNIIKDLLQYNGVRSAYAVNRKGEKVKFVVETRMPLDEFFSLKGNEILRNDESVQVKQAIGSFQDERFLVT